MKSKVLRLVVSGGTVAELKENMTRTLAELNGEETTAKRSTQPAARHEDTGEGFPETTGAQGSGSKAPVFISPDAAIPIDFKIAQSLTQEIPPTKDAVMQTPAFGLDSMGLPWDERIHSTSAAKNKDGSWRTRRGVEPATVKQVEHELIAKLKTGQPEIAPPQAVNPVMASPIVQAPGHSPAPVLASPVTASPILQMVPSHVPAAVIPPIPAAVPVTSAHSFQTFKAQLVPTLYALTEQGRLTPEYIQALKKHFQVEEIWQVNDAQLAEIFENFCKAGLLTRVG